MIRLPAFVFQAALGDVVALKVQDPASVMRHDHQDVEHAERDCGDSEEVHGHHITQVVLQK